MAETPKRVLPTALGTSTATILTAGGASTWQVVRSILIANIHTAAVTVNVGIATSNTDTDTTRIASALPVGVGETIELLSAPLIMQGHASTPDILHALCSVANKATITVSYIEGP